VQARTETGGTGPEELLFVTREHQADGTFKHDYDLSNADAAVDRGPDRGVLQHECTLIALPPQHALAASERARSAVPPSIA